MATSRRLVAALAVCLASAAVFAVTAVADGDPASDVLYAQDVFVPYTKPSPGAVAKVAAAVGKANESGYRIKVAVISSLFDLGTATALYNKPQRYADFLGAEIRFFYHGHLLVVMPGGFGVNFGGRGTALPQKLLETLHAAGRKPDDLASAAASAVALLAAKDTSKPRYRDTYPPNGQPLPFVTKVGADVKLQYSVYDDSLRASALVTVYGKANAVLLRRDRPLGPATGAIETIRWLVPVAYRRHTIRLCVAARDPAGNVSPPGCAPVRLP